MIGKKVIDYGKEWEELFENIASLHTKCQEKYNELKPLIIYCENLHE